MGLIVDLFAGGGGASTGIEWALGRSPDIAINHDPLALAMHEANHPNTKHVVENVWKVRPREIIGKAKVDILWASPDCTHFSKAKGEAPNRDPNRAKRSRGLAWVIWHWARQVRPTLIFMENVEEWNDWGPLLPDGRPNPERKGQTRKKFVRKLEREGYKVWIGTSRACEFGAPTIRQRLFMVARCDGLPIKQPVPTHGSKDTISTDMFSKALQPYRTAAEIIEWDVRCPSIFTRSKPLAKATNRRIARGMKRYVIDNARPFIVPLTHHGDDGSRVYSIDEPLKTITTAHNGELALAEPYLVGCAHGEDEKRGRGDWPLREPIRTVTGSNDRALVAPYVVRVDHSSAAHKNGIHAITEPTRTVTSSGAGALVNPFLAGCGGRAAQSPERPVTKPAGTITGKADQVLVAPVLTVFRADNDGQPIDRPAPTVTANSYIKRPGGSAPMGVSAAFLAKHYGGHETPGASMDEPVSTITTQDHHHLVAASIVKFKGTAPDGQPVTEPLDTIQTGGDRGGGHYGLSHAFLTKYYSEGGQDQAADEPMHTLTAKARLSLVKTSAGSIPISEEERLAAWWVARYVEENLAEPTPAQQFEAQRRKASKGKLRRRVTVIWSTGAALPGPRDSFVCAAGIPIVDIGMRMLTLRELFRAQGFPDTYKIAPVVTRRVRGKIVTGPLPKTDGTRMCGNSVSPHHAMAYLLANPLRPPTRARKAA